MSNYFLGFGINEYDGAPLNGCVNDIKNSLEMLVKGWGSGVRFDMNDCRPCTDFRADREGMQFRLEQIAKRAQAGDKVFIAVSSHGAQIPTRNDENGDVDGITEVICPYGFDFDNPRSYLPDYVFASIMNRFVEGVNCTVLLDCCFSGGMPNDKDLNPRKNRNKAKPRLSRAYPVRKNFDMDHRMKIIEEQGIVRKLKTGHISTRTVLANVAVIAGCQELQTCADAWFGDKTGYQGAATKAFWEVVKTYPEVPLQDIVIEMADSLKAAKFDQIPVLIAPPHLATVPFMGDPR